MVSNQTEQAQQSTGASSPDQTEWLLEILRSRSSASDNQGGQTYPAAREKLAEDAKTVLTGFFQKKLSASVKTIALFDGNWLKAEQTAEGSDLAGRVQIISLDEKPLIYFGIAGKDFKTLMQNAFGQALIAGQNDQPLSGSETRLLQKLADQFATQFFSDAIFDAENIVPKPARVCEAESPEEALAKGGAFHIVILDIEIEKTGFCLEIVLPSDFLNINAANNAEASTEAKSQNPPNPGKSWESRLGRIVKTLPVPASCEFFSSDYLLGKVRTLRIGEQIVANDALNQIQIIDEEGKLLVRGRLHLEKGRMLFKVTRKGAATNLEETHVI